MKGLRMTLRELSQLYYLNREIEMDQKRLEKLQRSIQEDEESIAVLRARAAAPSSPRYSGMPHGSDAGSKVESDAIYLVDAAEYLEHKKKLLKELVGKIELKRLQCIKERIRLEEYIATLPNSYLRSVFTCRFVSGMSWQRVADEMGGNATDESVKKACYRFLKCL